MAVNTAGWMSNTSDLEAIKPASTHATEPHKDWPWRNRNTGGLPFTVLAQALNSTSKGCGVQEYIYQGHLPNAVSMLKWRPYRGAATVEDLVAILKVRTPADAYSTFFIVTDTSPEVIQALGYHLHITPRFFDIPYTILSTGNRVRQYSFFSLQLMERYSLGERPAEACRNDASPRTRFSTKDGPLPHEWHVTRVAVVFLIDETRQNLSKGLVLLDNKDQAIAKALEKLMMRDEATVTGGMGTVAGQGQILTGLFHIINVTWDVFLGEAEAHLRYLSVKCIDEDLSPTDQLRYTRALHQLSPLWVQVRRRLVATRTVAKQMMARPDLISRFVHPQYTEDDAPYYTSDAQEAFEGYMNNCVNVVEDQIDRSKELAEETSNLISLILNITTMQDTRATIAESKAANAFAASIRRITVLTFVYLPLTLAAV
ncbi:hypothetical protein CLCR_02911 [Cladophialophora carrionii]|uniref:Uncharacterized protein n=1 Tax=Cladophialophora carrionii TaxID=86049 RepID=A0A1C1D2J8_9EURO|nr:hypothetical protein CLCR_02911 [Cladophialophora carrionii]